MNQIKPRAAWLSIIEWVTIPAILTKQDEMIIDKFVHRSSLFSSRPATPLGQGSSTVDPAEVLGQQRYPSNTAGQKSASVPKISIIWNLIHNMTNSRSHSLAEPIKMKHLTPINGHLQADQDFLGSLFHINKYPFLMRHNDVYLDEYTSLYYVHRNESILAYPGVLQYRDIGDQGRKQCQIQLR